MSLYFKAGNDVMGDMHITEIDFVVRDDNEDIIEHDLPQNVLEAINVLRAYGQELENQ
jgi:hypothetical protein